MLGPLEDAGAKFMDGWNLNKFKRFQRDITNYGEDLPKTLFKASVDLFSYDDQYIDDTKQRNLRMAKNIYLQIDRTRFST